MGGGRGVVKRMCENYILGLVGTFRAWGGSTENLTPRNQNKIQPRNKRNPQPLPAQNSYFRFGRLWRRTGFPVARFIRHWFAQ